MASSSRSGIGIRIAQAGAVLVAVAALVYVVYTAQQAGEDTDKQDRSVPAKAVQPATDTTAPAAGPSEAPDPLLKPREADAPDRRPAAPKEVSKPQPRVFMPGSKFGPIPELPGPGAKPLFLPSSKKGPMPQLDPGARPVQGTE